MNEEEQSSERLQKLMKLSILIMLVLLIVFPFGIEIRYSWLLYPEILLDTILIIAWSWVYSVVGYTAGFYDFPTYLLIQYGSISTIFQIIFLGAYIGFILGLTTRKSAIRIGVVSLFPALLVMGVNLLAVFVPGASSVTIQIPLQVISILGLVILRVTTPKRSRDHWLAE